MVIVNELFYSLQGEGRLSGVPSIFIRLAGCPLRCRWCDTKYALERDAGVEMSLRDIKDKIAGYPTRHIVITGGEPLLSDSIEELCQSFETDDVHITIETAGIKVVNNLRCDLMSISPKLSNSMPEMAGESYQRVMTNHDATQSMIEHYDDYQLKFVVDKASDLDEIAEYIDLLEGVDPEKVYLMPQAVERDEYLEKSPLVSEFCMETGFSFSPRLQVVLWGNERGS
jgi:7-carboxy-7-deazaguanine synthase